MFAAASPAGTSNHALAVRRLQQDMKEMAGAPPLPMRLGACAGTRWGIDAKPSADNIFVWDVEMSAASGPLRHQSIYMRITFPPSYPTHPPDVRLLTPIPNHPNVFGGWICLDMLKSPELHALPYQGWSAAYSVPGVLLQLYGFLLVDEYVVQMYGDYAVKRKGNGVAAASDEQEQEQKQGQQQLQQWRHIVHSAPGAGKRALKRAAAAAAASAVAAAPQGGASESPEEQLGQHKGVVEPQLDRLDEHLLRCVLEPLAAPDLLRCMATAPSRLARAAADVKQRGDLQCFFTRGTYKDTVLGFGVQREWHEGQRRAGTLKSLIVRLDYLSMDAFLTAGVRRSAWNAPIDGFLPLYLNPEHGARSLLALPSCVERLVTKSPTATSIRMETNGEVPPLQLLTVLSQAMNSLVVEMVRIDKGDIPTHMSDAALRGFAHLHHLLLAVATSPSGAGLVLQARRDVAAFINGGDGGRARHKEACPDLGVLLVELLLVPKQEVPWGCFLPAFLRELLSRQVLWALKAERSSRNNRNAGATSSSTYSGPSATGYARAFDFGVVAEESQAGDSWHSLERLRRHFESGLTGLRAVQLTCWFGLELARPQTVSCVMQELASVKRSYDECSGAPKPRALAAFHAHALAVLDAGTWGKVLANLRAALRFEVGTPPDPRKLWAAALRQAVVDSYVAGYHDNPPPFGYGRLRAGAGATGGGRAVPTGTTPRQKIMGPWSNLHAPDPDRLAAVRRVFGEPFVDWECDNKPIMAMDDA